MMKRLGILGILVAMTMACSEQKEATTETARQAPDNSRMQVISGSVLYRERIALPPGAEVTVVLEDQSRMDVPATPITDYTHITDGPPPYSFRLVYDPSAIDERGTYGLRARIEADGELLFTTTEHIDPFATPPGEKIEILVTSAGGR